MSKPASGHFSGTSGCRDWQIISHNQKNSDILIPNSVDLREHPVKYKLLSSKKMRELGKKLNNRTITKAEYERYEWQRRLTKRRQNGIDLFWRREKKLIEEKRQTTRNWSAAQREDILKNKRPKYKGVTIQSHHMFSVSRFPHLADKGQFIYPATRHEHFERWHGGNYKNSLPGRPMNLGKKEDF